MKYTLKTLFFLNLAASNAFIMGDIFTHQNARRLHLQYKELN